MMGVQFEDGTWLKAYERSGAEVDVLIPPEVAMQFLQEYVEWVNGVTAQATAIAKGAVDE